MIELVAQRREVRIDFGEIHNPALFRVNGAAHVHLDPETVAVQPSALVPGRHIRQPMGRLEGEFPEDLH